MISILPGAQAIQVTRLNTLLYGQPGSGKTSLAFTAQSALLIDCDNGAHRAQNRQDIIQPNSFADILALLGTPDGRAAIAKYSTIIIDTVGELINLMILHIRDNEAQFGLKPGKGYNHATGTLVIQGWGALKSLYRSFLAQLKATGKDIIFIAQQEEEKNDTGKFYRPQIMGSAYDMTLSSADLVAYIRVEAQGQRVALFAPSDEHYGKDSAGIGRCVIPSNGMAPDFMAQLLAKAKTQMGQVSETSRALAEAYAEWLDRITEAAEMQVPAALNELVPTIAAIDNGTLKAQVKSTLARLAAENGMAWDTAANGFAIKEETTKAAA